MILYHPLNRKNEANKKAIEKYKDREVKIFSKSNGKWMNILHMFMCDSKSLAFKFTFKNALKLTKNSLPAYGIEYHFVDGIGDEKPNIKDFDTEDHINCPTVKFEKYYQPHTKRGTQKGTQNDI